MPHHNLLCRPKSTFVTGLIIATMINLAILQLIRDLEMEIATSSSTEAGAESQTVNNTQEAGTQTSPSRMNVYTQVRPKTSTEG